MKDDKMGIVKAVCTSREKGTAKTNIKQCKFIEEYGLENDAHAGPWHRQVSLLSMEKVEEFKKLIPEIKEGAFGENLLVEGFDFKNLPVGTCLKCNDVILEITQIGKECHSSCAIRKQTGDCIMPREGVFARVIHGGTIGVGDKMKIIPKPYKFSAAILTLSDKGARGEREDLSGQAIRKILEENSYHIQSQNLLTDDEDGIFKELCRLCDQEKVDVVFTTGGTGFSARDNTPEATMRASQKNVPGIAEAIRAYSMTITKRAMLSRAVSVIRGKTLIINLPGSPKAVKEVLEYILEPIEHGIEILTGKTGECAR